MPIDWANERSIATESDIGRFVESVGGARIDERIKNNKFEIADYVFDNDHVIVELKILETEFGDVESFRRKGAEIDREVVGLFGIEVILRTDPATSQFRYQRRLELFRRPLARVARKANRQIRSTRNNLNLKEYRGILLLVNDGFRELDSEMVIAIMSRILTGANSEIHAFIYLTNHYVHIPNSNYAHLLWVPVYAVGSEDLSGFVNRLGSNWFDFVEAETDTFDVSLKTPDYERIRGARPIR